MTHSFVSFSLPRQELPELYRSLATSFMIEQILRNEQGLEPVDPPLFLQNVERLLRVAGESPSSLMEQAEEELWAHAWYIYTDEWAWFRAKEDVMRELGERLSRTKHDVLDRLVEKTYRKKFDQYVAEIDMQPKVSMAQPQKKKK
ncbi:MAG: hypothetical protein Q7N87_03015 [Candidatus Uhrbacteria bacterium]|nr:hypothetical protein [Candidatus Uhrbacteria bacterium]